MKSTAFFFALLLGLLSACSSAPIRLDRGRIESPAMGRPMDYAVYTPPGWTRSERLPLVVFLHGAGDSEACFDRARVGQALDQAITEGRAPRVVICVPDGELGFWENWYDRTRHYRDWVMDDLVPHVRATYNTLEGRQNTHLAGISMGGHGALRFARKEPNEFSSAAIISAPLLDSEHVKHFADSIWVRLFVPKKRIWGSTGDYERIREEDVFRQWQTQEDLGGHRVMLAHGDDDKEGVVLGNSAFHQHLRERGVDHEYLVYSGAHAWKDWRPLFPEVLRFLVEEEASGPVVAAAEATPVGGRSASSFSPVDETLRVDASRFESDVARTAQR